MKSFEIMYYDLNDDAKKEFLIFQGVKNESELNFEDTPIAIVDLEEEDE